MAPDAPFQEGARRLFPSHTQPDKARPELGRNLTYGLLDHLGRAIVTGEFDSRPFPTEAELTRQYGVSHTVTREAVKMLTAKGLLSARPRRGTVIEPTESWNLFDRDVLNWLLERKFSIELLKQFTQLRVVIEPEAAALAAEHATREEVAAIADQLARMKAAEEGLDDPLEADIGFHVAILRASGNPFFDQFRDVVGTALRFSIRFTNSERGRTANIADHRRVQDAIVRRDPESARVRMRALIGGVLELINWHESQSVPSASADSGR